MSNDFNFNDLSKLFRDKRVGDLKKPNGNEPKEINDVPLLGGEGHNFDEELLTEEGFVNKLYVDDNSPEENKVSKDQLKAMFDAVANLDGDGKMSSKELSYLAALGNDKLDKYLDETDIQAIIEQQKAEEEAEAKANEAKLDAKARAEAEAKVKAETAKAKANAKAEAEAKAKSEEAARLSTNEAAEKSRLKDEKLKIKTQFSNCKRIKTDEKTGKKYAVVEAWDPNNDRANNCLDRIIRHSYDLKAMGITVDDDNYKALKEAVMDANKDIYGTADGKIKWRKEVGGKGREAAYLKACDDIIYLPETYFGKKAGNLCEDKSNPCGDKPAQNPCPQPAPASKLEPPTRREEPPRYAPPSRPTPPPTEPTPPPTQPTTPVTPTVAKREFLYQKQSYRQEMDFNIGGVKGTAIQGGTQKQITAMRETLTDGSTRTTYPDGHVVIVNDKGITEYDANGKEQAHYEPVKIKENGKTIDAYKRTYIDENGHTISEYRKKPIEGNDGSYTDTIYVDQTTKKQTKVREREYTDENGQLITERTDNNGNRQVENFDGTLREQKVVNPDGSYTVENDEEVIKYDKQGQEQEHYQKIEISDDGKTARCGDKVVPYKQGMSTAELLLALGSKATDAIVSTANSRREADALKRSGTTVVNSPVFNNPTPTFTQGNGGSSEPIIIRGIDGKDGAPGATGATGAECGSDCPPGSANAGASTTGGLDDDNPPPASVSDDGSDCPPGSANAGASTTGGLEGDNPPPASVGGGDSTTDVGSANAGASTTGGLDDDNTPPASVGGGDSTTDVGDANAGASTSPGGLDEDVAGATAELIRDDNGDVTKVSYSDSEGNVELLDLDQDQFTFNSTDQIPSQKEGDELFAANDILSNEPLTVEEPVYQEMPETPQYKEFDFSETEFTEPQFQEPPVYNEPETYEAPIEPQYEEPPVEELPADPPAIDDIIEILDDKDIPKE